MGAAAAAAVAAAVVAVHLSTYLCTDELAGGSDERLTLRKVRAICNLKQHSVHAATAAWMVSVTRCVCLNV